MQPVFPTLKRRELSASLFLTKLVAAKNQIEAFFLTDGIDPEVGIILHSTIFFHPLNDLIFVSFDK